ncbi:MAG: hypothetical protein GY802_15005 [Gammaproteobacteria bacterium]|nr:hypothetical protein [Gammaproteobacteria bacterium]
MNTPAFSSGRYMVDIEGSGASEHAVHHFHGLILQAYQCYTLDGGMTAASPLNPALFLGRDRE